MNDHKRATLIESMLDSATGTRIILYIHGERNQDGIWTLAEIELGGIHFTWQGSR